MNRRRIPLALQNKIRQQAHFRCGYCLTSETLIGMKMEFEHLTPLAAGGETSEEICGWRVAAAMNSKAYGHTRLILKPTKTFRFSIRERKTGTNIFGGMPTEPKFSAFRQSDAPPSSHQNLTMK